MRGAAFALLLAASVAAALPSAASAQPGMPAAGSRQLIELTIAFEVETPSRPVVVGTTNLPDGAQLMASIYQPGPGTGLLLGQAIAEVAGGRFRMGPFSNGGAPYRPGRYKAQVTMPLAAMQPERVQRVIGDKGQWLSGAHLDFGGPITALGPSAQVEKFFDVPADPPRTAPPSSPPAPPQAAAPVDRGTMRLSTERNDARALIKLADEANDICRGSSDNPTMEDACEARGVYTRRLDALGWCRGKKGEFGYQQRWHRCGPTSHRAS